MKDRNTTTSAVRPPSSFLYPLAFKASYSHHPSHEPRNHIIRVGPGTQICQLRVKLASYGPPAGTVTQAAPAAAAAAAASAISQILVRHHDHASDVTGKFGAVLS